MKKLMNFWLMAALVCGLGLSVTSCKDDDDDNKSEEQQQQEQEQTASKFWSVVGQLVSTDDYTADYADKTFEPTYGTADATNATTRIVEVNDMATAASYFADLVGASIDENTPSYNYSDPEVGTLTYTRGGTASEWATVDVSIKQLPSLRKIIYRQGGEGTNTSFVGKAYYRFGDVVKRTLDNGRVEYWICVRPAFGPESTSSSFWACVNYLPEKNTFKYEYQGKSWIVPTGIGTDKKNMQNLAEMLYAIFNPQTWYENATNYHTDGKYWGYTGMPIFNDWTKANLKYHNKYFWEKVQKAWTNHKISEEAMNLSMEKLSASINENGLQLLYKGYSWWTKTSWNCTLYEASFTNGATNDEKNLHHAAYRDVQKRMQDIKFDCTKMGLSKSNYTEFFGDDKYRWVVRFATGEELNDGTKPAPTAELQGKGVKTVYRYYDEYQGEWVRKGPDGENTEVAIPDVEPLTELKIGAIIGHDGKFYNNVTDAKNASGMNPEAIVVCLNGNKRVERGQDWNGLAILLKPTESLAWGEIGQNCGADVKLFEQSSGAHFGYLLEKVNDQDVRYYVADQLNGMYFTQYYANGCNGKNHNHPAAKACNYEVFPNIGGFSRAFMPSAGQFILAMKGLGIEWDRDWGFGNPDRPNYDKKAEANQVKAAKKILDDSGCGLTVTTRFMTTNKVNSEAEAIFMFDYSIMMKGMLFEPVINALATHPFIAFKYDGGATED